MIFEVDNKHINLSYTHFPAIIRRAISLKPNWLDLSLFLITCAQFPKSTLLHLKSGNYFCLTSPVSQVCKNERELLSQLIRTCFMFLENIGPHLIHLVSKEWGQCLSIEFSCNFLNKCFQKRSHLFIHLSILFIRLEDHYGQWLCLFHHCIPSTCICTWHIKDVPLSIAGLIIQKLCVQIDM